MRLTNLFAAAAIAATTLTSTAFAGGLATVIVEPGPIVVPVVTAPRSSWGIILPLVGLALLIGLASSSADDET